MTHRAFNPEHPERPSPEQLAVHDLTTYAGRVANASQPEALTHFGWFGIPPDVQYRGALSPQIEGAELFEFTTPAGERSFRYQRPFMQPVPGGMADGGFRSGWWTWEWNDGDSVVTETKQIGDSDPVIKKLDTVTDIEWRLPIELVESFPPQVTQPSRGNRVTAFLGNILTRRG